MSDIEMGCERSQEDEAKEANRYVTFYTMTIGLGRRLQMSWALAAVEDGADDRWGHGSGTEDAT